MDAEKLARKVELEAMELRGYLTRLVEMAAEVESFSRKCERASETSRVDKISKKKASLWEEAFEFLEEATSNFPFVIESLEDIVSGVENAPTPLDEIAQISAAEAIVKHDQQLAKRSAFNR